MFENLTISARKNYPPVYSNEEIVLFSGILGIHPNLTKEDSISIEITTYADVTLVIIKSAALERLELLIYNIANYIENFCIRGVKQKAGIAAKWVDSQSRAAYVKGFRHLEAMAYRDKSGTTTDWSGYIVWGKVGYVLAGNSVQDFKDLMLQKDRTEQSMAKLISTEAGLNFWIAEGFPWQAIFDLTKDSKSFEILTRYLDEKTSRS